MLSSDGETFSRFGLAAFALLAAWLTMLRPPSISFIDQVTPTILLCVGAFGFAGPLIPPNTLPSLVTAKLAVALIALAIWLAKHREPKKRESALDKQKLPKPMAYLFVYVAATCLPFGIVAATSVPDLTIADANAGLAIGSVLGGVLIYAAGFFESASKKLDVLTRISLVALILSWLMFLQPLWLASTLCVCGIGCSLFIYLSLRLSEDLALTFNLKPRFILIVYLVFIACTFIGYGTGWLMEASGIMKANSIIVVVACVAATTIATVYGLSSERIWTASGFEEEDAEQDITDSREEACANVARLYSLTPRETEVLGLLSKGRNAAFIETELVISSHTVKSHMLNIYRKLEVHTQQELISLVERNIGNSASDSPGRKSPL